MSATLTFDIYGNDITCMKEYDALLHPCNECDNYDCEDREVYEEDQNRRQTSFKGQKEERK